ncbi:hypothetical protein [Streptomyces chartreusis]
MAVEAYGALDAADQQPFGRTDQVRPGGQHAVVSGRPLSDCSAARTAATTSARLTEAESAAVRSAKVLGHGATAIHLDGVYGML